MRNSPVNINCDLGEGLDNEALIMPLIDSCNIACGGHAGDTATMERVIALARKHQVNIGAHPSYPDRENFGRKSLQLPPEVLKASLIQQMAGFAEALGGDLAALHHIKAHGALYNDLAVDEQLAATYLEALEAYKDHAALYVPFDSVIERMAEKRGFKTLIEAFGDRNYTDNLKLVSRKHPEALITDKKKVLQHILAISRGKVKTLEGKQLPIKADTVCIHSDTDNALEILIYLKENLN